MTLERFSERFRQTLVSQGVAHPVGLAVINDFLRALHEAFVKSDRDYPKLLQQVEAALGTAATIDLMRLLKLDQGQRRIPLGSPRNHLKAALAHMCAERGIALNAGCSLIAQFLLIFRQECFDESGNEESKVWFLRFGVRDEAAFHFCGLFTGEDLWMCCEAQDRLDRRMRRFGALVDMWELEKEWDDQEAAREAEYQEDENAVSAQLGQIASFYTVETDDESRRVVIIQREIVDATINALAQMPDNCRLSGEDSVLANVWEEICAQVQSEYSFFWDAYVETMVTFLRGFLEDRSPTERDLVLRDLTEDEALELLLKDTLSRAADYESDTLTRYNCWRAGEEDSEY